MQTIKELYQDAILMEEPFLAHYIYCLLLEQKIKLEDDVKILNSVRIDSHKLLDLIERNQLGFSLIKVFALKENTTRFIFIFAKDQQEAISHFKKILNKNPINCHEYSMDTPMSKGNRFLTFREMRMETTEFPSVIGYFEKNYQSKKGY